jgi:hypothetical protein
MFTAQGSIESFHRAVQAEDALYRQLGGKSPGQPGFPPRLWAEWLEAVAKTTAAANAMRKACERESKERSSY